MEQPDRPAAHPCPPTPRYPDNAETNSPHPRRWIRAEQEALQAYRDDLSLDSASVVEWTGPRSSSSAERLWLVYTPEGAGRGVVFAAELDDGRWVVAHEQLCADFQP